MTHPELQDHYKILELSPNADQEQIKQAYRRLARKFHPDVSTETDAEQQFKRIKEAYEVLTNPLTRFSYREKTIVRPYTYLWMRLQVAARLRIVAQLYAQISTKNRINAQLNQSVKITMNAHSPPPIFDDNQHSGHFFQKKKLWFLWGGGTIFIASILITTYLILEKLEDWQGHQKLREAILTQKPTGIEQLGKSPLETQLIILQGEDTKKALLNYYVEHSPPELLQQLSTLPLPTQQAILQDESAQVFLVDYYKSLTQELVKTDQFEQASQLLKTVQEKLPKLAAVTALLEKISQQKIQRLADLSDQYARCLEQPQASLLEKTHCVNETRDKIKQVGVGHDLPVDPKLATLYGEAIDLALQAREYSQVSDLLSDWEKLLPEQTEQRALYQAKWKQYQEIDDMVIELSSRDKSKIINNLYQLTSLDKSLQQEILQTPQVRRNLMLYHVEEALVLAKTEQDGQLLSYLEDKLKMTPEALQKWLTSARQQQTPPTLGSEPKHENDKAEVKNQNSTVATPSIDQSSAASPKPVGVDGLLGECDAHFNANRLTTGNGTALNCYQQVLQLDPSNQQAKSGLYKIEDRYQRWVENALQNGQLEKADSYLKGLVRVNPKSKELGRLKGRLAAAFQKRKAQKQDRLHEEVEPKARVTEKIEPEKVKVESPPPAPPMSKPIAPTVVKDPLPPIPKPEVVPPKKPAASVEVCEGCNCSDLLRQISIGVKPLTAQENEFFQKRCN